MSVFYAQVVSAVVFCTLYRGQIDCTFPYAAKIIKQRKESDGCENSMLNIKITIPNALKAVPKESYIKIKKI